MDHTSGQVHEKELRAGVLMGRDWGCVDGGAYGLIYADNHSHLLVKQNKFDKDPWETSDLAKEYRIANFLELNLPSFVAAPFSLIRGVSPYHVEKLSFVQQRIHGKTLARFCWGDFTKPNLLSLFLQCIEVLLRVGGALSIRDMHCGNVMVDTRVAGAPRIKFIDFGLWGSEDPSITDSKYRVMLENLFEAWRPMKYLLNMMELYREVVSAHLIRDSEHTEFLRELPSRIASIFGEIVHHSEEFTVIQKLCSIRYLQNHLSLPIGVISELVDISQVCCR